MSNTATATVAVTEKLNTVTADSAPSGESLQGNKNERVIVFPKEEQPKKKNIDTLMGDLIVQLSGEQDNAVIGDLMNQAGKLSYVRQQHKYEISQVTEGVTHRGYWKTRYIDPNGNLKVIYRKESKDLIDFLYQYYQEGTGAAKTFETVFKELMEYKKTIEQRSDRTLIGWQYYYDKYLSGLGTLVISEIQEEHLRMHISSVICPMKPKADAMHHTICNLKKVFEFAVKKHYIKDSPAESIDYRDYMQFADRSQKDSEDTYFNEEEMEKLRLSEWEEWKDTKSPRALIVLLNIETGMRAGETVALHVEDIKDGYIDIHRQQIRIDHPKPYRFVEVEYTKDTRSSVNTSRYFPITPRIQEVLDAAMQLPGESVYLFHDADGNMIKKDGYEQYLRRHVQKLGITGKTNNHAIRKGFNSNILIARGVPANERAAILGHTTRTNERNYSPRKKDSLNRLRDTLSR